MKRSNNQTTRRQFLSTSTTAIVGLPFLRVGHLFSESAKKQRWGIILNTVKNEMKVDYRGTLERLAEMGYRYLEGGSYGDSTEDYYRFTKKLGLKTIIGGTSMSNLQESLDQYIERGNQLHYKYITCYWPWMSDAKSLTKRECMETAERLNTIGKRITEEGFGFTWHNHDKEFAEVEGKTAFDWLLQNTDPQWVNVQMDTYWVRKGNHEPVDLIRKYPGRFKLLHIKDMDNTPERGMTCAGAGNIDFKAILELWELAGVDYATVENERATDGIPCAQTSITHLKSIAL